MEQEKTSADPLPNFSFREQNGDEIAINPSGHHQELERNFGLLSACGFAVTAGNAWVALGGSVVNSLTKKPEHSVKKQHRL